MSKRRIIAALAVVFVCLASVVVRADTHYVAQGAGNNPPYTNWADAANTIQAACDVAASDDVVMVSNGVYQTNTRKANGDLLNRLVISNAIDVYSVNGTDYTTIDGDNSYRCAYVASGACLSGFTLTDGRTLSGSMEKQQDKRGGGVYCEPGGIVSTCVIINCWARYFGGGAFQGTIVDSTLQQNEGWKGGGACEAELIGCMVISNKAYDSGGGLCDGPARSCTFIGNYNVNYGGALSGGTGPVEYCVFRGNSCEYDGGALNLGSGSTVRWCRIEGNVAGQSAGGGTVGSYSLIENCLIISNTASSEAGGLRLPPDAIVQNCTFSKNQASWGGAYYCTGPGNSIIRNTISFGNGGSFGVNGYGPATYENCRITDDPLVVDADAGNYRLQTNSPCIDAGTNFPPVGHDMDGLPRPLDGDADGTATVDIGAYELMNEDADSDGDGMPDGYESTCYGGPTNGQSEADQDSDGANNLHEYVADTIHSNAGSFFTTDAQTTTISFATSSSREYTLQRRIELLEGDWANVPPYVDVPGDGGDFHWTMTQDVDRACYRVQVALP